MLALAEMIIALMAVMFLVLGIFLFRGKGKWLIAGYNTASNEEKAKYDDKKLCRAVSVVCFATSIMLFVMAYIGNRISVGVMNEDAMKSFAAIFVVVILAATAAVIVYINTKAKK